MAFTAREIWTIFERHDTEAQENIEVDNKSRTPRSEKSTGWNGTLFGNFKRVQPVGKAALVQVEHA